MKHGLKRWLSTGLLLGSIGCVDTTDDGDTTTQVPAPAKPGQAATPTPGQPGQPAQPAQPGQPVANPPAAKPTPGNPEIPVSTVLASLSAAADCTDLLTQIQDDAIAKLKLQVETYKKQPPQTNPGGGIAVGVRDAGAASAPTANAGEGVARPSAPLPPSSASDEDVASDSSGGGKKGSGPTGASDTNNQVEGVDEADFVKVVDSGKGIFVLHGNTLRKLKSWPAAETALVSQPPLVIEGSPIEMFVTDEGKAVVFSSVFGYPSSSGGAGYVGPVCPPSIGPGSCYRGGSNTLKITVADVTGTPKVERELFYEGTYLSSRRYDGPDSDVVRAVIQAYSKYSGLYAPDIEWSDAWGRPYDPADIASQLDEWEQRTTSAIRKTELDEWIPTAREVVDGKLVDIEPACDSYFVPQAGLSDYGLTHILALDVAKPNQQVGGVTIVGAASTVYSNDKQLVLAQPDYRWGGNGDFGITNEQQTALHVFGLSGDDTNYQASGWVFGHLPQRNTQFGIDAAADGTLRVVTTGMVRDDPSAKPNTEDFWKQHTESYVITARASGDKLEPVGKSVKLGKEGETVQSARFVGDRAYVVTYRQIDPLYVLDVSNALAPTLLGEISIPGFSEYMHPLDANHLITFGQSGTGGVQLQLFDVTNPKQLPAPKTLAFGSGSSSEVSYNHKAFTLFEGVLALPLHSYYTFSGGINGKRAAYQSTLEVAKVDATVGFTKLASIDHSRLYADNGAGVICGSCDATACYDYACSYEPELRRGHFVKSDDKTFVYSFSHAGVLVNDLSAPKTAVAQVGLPAPTLGDYAPWYPDADGANPVTADAGQAPPPKTDAGRPRDAGVRDGGVAAPTDPAVAPSP
jgi:hypothetical protein